jgi:hypothetical protein
LLLLIAAQDGIGVRGTISLVKTQVGSAISAQQQNAAEWLPLRLLKAGLAATIWEFEAMLARRQSANLGALATPA